MRRIIKLLLLAIICQRRRRRKGKRYSIEREQCRLLMNLWLNNSFFCREFVKMTPTNFEEICSLLKYSPKTRIETKLLLAIALNFLARNESVAQQCLIFGVSNTTVQKARVDGIKLLNQVFNEVLKLSKKYWRKCMKHIDKYPEFIGDFAALDGTHIKVRVPIEKQEKFRNRKGYLSLNVMLLCDFNQRILFCWPGFGSSHDSFVFKNSPLPTLFQTLPKGKFVLADAGYALSTRVLTPFRGVRYHLQEFKGSDKNPQNPKELFNLRHSKRRNVIERTIGILKRRWRLLRFGNESMNMEFINECIEVCCHLHNYLMDRKDDCLDGEFDDSRSYINDFSAFEYEEEENDSEFNKNWREWLATTMWNGYNV